MVVKTQLEMMDKISMKANDSVLEPLLAANPGEFSLSGSALYRLQDKQYVGRWRDADVESFLEQIPSIRTLNLMETR